MYNRTFKDIRQYLKLSQQEYADKLGVSISTIALIETNRLDVTERVKGKLAHTFDVTNEDFQSYIRRKRALEQHINEEN